MIDELSESEKKTGMVEQLGGEVCKIWYYVARKNHDVAQSNQKRYWGIMLKKLKRELRVCRLRMGGGGGYKLRYQTKQKCIYRKIIIKKQFHRSFPVSFISSSTSANNQPKFNSPYSRYNLYF